MPDAYMSKPLTTALLGSLLGGGGSYLAHRLRNKDEDESKSRALTQALMGAILGGAGGYATGRMLDGPVGDALRSIKTEDSKPKATVEKLPVKLDAEQSEATAKALEGDSALSRAANKVLNGVRKTDYARTESGAPIQFDDGSYVPEHEWNLSPSVAPRNAATLLTAGARLPVHLTQERGIAQARKLHLQHLKTMDGDSINKYLREEKLPPANLGKNIPFPRTAEGQAMAKRQAASVAALNADAQRKMDRLNEVRKRGGDASRANRRVARATENIEKLRGRQATELERAGKKFHARRLRADDRQLRQAAKNLTRQNNLFRRGGNLARTAAYLTAAKAFDHTVSDPAVDWFGGGNTLVPKDTD